MSDLSYAPRPEAEARVGVPATAVTVMAGLSIAAGLLGLLLHVLGIGLGALGPLRDDERIAQILGGGLGLATNILSILLNSVALFGGLRMKALRSYGLSLAAAVIVALPCVGCCCLIGTPVGVWALVVLLNADVKAAFR